MAASRRDAVQRALADPCFLAATYRQLFSPAMVEMLELLPAAAAALLQRLLPQLQQTHDEQPQPPLRLPSQPNLIRGSEAPPAAEPPMDWGHLFDCLKSRQQLHPFEVAAVARSLLLDRAVRGSLLALHATGFDDAESEDEG
jgi:hypothetical protein